MRVRPVRVLVTGTAATYLSRRTRTLHVMHDDGFGQRPAKIRPVRLPQGVPEQLADFGVRERRLTLRLVQRVDARSTIVANANAVATRSDSDDQVTACSFRVPTGILACQRVLTAPLTTSAGRKSSSSHALISWSVSSTSVTGRRPRRT